MVWNGHPGTTAETPTIVGLDARAVDATEELGFAGAVSRLLLRGFLFGESISSAWFCYIEPGRMTM
jgi:hypothetical protein